jgi:predicted small lipoprotein YifL
MQTVRNVILLLIYLVLLAACGLKGPLYLPAEQPVSEPAAGLETDAATDEGEKKAKPQKEKSADKQNGR